MEPTADRVRKLIADHLGVDIAKVTDAASFASDLGVDSLDTVELIVSVEEEFGIEIPDDVDTHITTVREAIAYVERGIA